MVAGKVKIPMPKLQKSATPPTPPPPRSSKSSFSCSLAAYFPRSSSAQVQPRPPDVADLLRLVEDLRDRESRLKIQLLEHKLLKEAAAIVPLLENDLGRHVTRIEELEADNQRLTKELDDLRLQCDQDKARAKALEDQILLLKKTASDHSRQNEDLSSSHSQRFLKALNKSFNKTALDQGKHLQFAAADDPKLHVPDNRKRSDSEELADSALTNEVRSRVPRVPKPPPRRSSAAPSSPHSPSSVSSDSSALENHNVRTEQSIRQPPKPGPNPPPPPPPPKATRAVSAKVRRVPEVAEFYHSLMRREPSQSRRESSSVVAEVPATANARDMIGEIENRSSHLLAIKTDVKTQGEFIRCLIKEVEGAAFTDIEDVVLFVKWLDDELSYLVDERAVLKHFDWPEQKADALREAAFGYCDMKKLESEASSFPDDPRQPCGPAFKKMQSLLEKLEHGVYNISKMRESATHRYKLFQIPVHWMLDNGFASQIKLASVKLAMKYMKRVSAELETVGGGPEEEELIVQGVRFAFRVHQFAGGFDVETMRAFQELRDKANSCHVQCHGHQQKFLCRPATC